MTRPVLRAAGALLFFSTLPTLAAVPPGPAEHPPYVRVVPHPSPLIDAFKTAVQEMTARPASATYAQWLDTLPGFRFSPATSKLLMRELGTSRPFTVKRQPLQGGGREYVFTAPALRHAKPDGSMVAWETIAGTARVDADGKTITNQFSAPRVMVEDKTMRLEMRALTIAGTSTDTELMYGTGTGDMGSLQMTTKADGSTLMLDGLYAKFAATDDGPTVGMHYDTGIRTITAGGERIDDLHLGIGFKNLDKTALERFAKLSRKFKAEESTLARLPPKIVRDDFFAPLMRQLALAVTANGAAIELEDLSFAYRGNKASMHGQMHMENVTPADLDQPVSLFKKAAGHFDIAMPVAMAHAFAENIARKQLAKQQPGADAAAITKLGDMLYDGMLKGALAAGYVRVDGDMLVTTIDIRDGVVLVNGKPLQLPKPTPPVAAVDSGAGTMRARRVAEKCALPDYPADVVSEDRALSMALQMRVKADGTVGKPGLARSSGIPAYDEAVLAAAAQCTYIPALRDGKPVAVSEVWEIVRVPGTPRP